MNLPYIDLSGEMPLSTKDGSSNPIFSIGGSFLPLREQKEKYLASF